MADLNIIFEDDSILVLDKEAGVVVNRSETAREETLQDKISEYLEIDGLGIGERAGIVHRLDRETSGLLVVAKTKKAFENLQKQFKERAVVKEYVGLVHGDLKEKSGRVEEMIGRVGSFGKFGVVSSGRESRTDFEVLESFVFRAENFEKLVDGENKNRKSYLKSHGRVYGLVSFFPKTGRTHQIRVHSKWLGHPIVSDLMYTPSKLLRFDRLWCPRLFLHAKYIEFAHPKSKKRMSFEASLPADLRKAMLYLSTMV